MFTDATTIASPFHRLERSATTVASWLIDLVFPPACSNCGRVDYRFCESCLQDLAEVPIDVTHTPAGGLHVIWATGMHSGVLQKAVQAFKYEGAKELSQHLAARLIMALRQQNWRIDVIVPVPLYADREEERGYNQSALLSQQVEGATGIRCRHDYLARVRATSQQAQLSGAERLSNVKDAFVASDDVKGLSVLLIDDVVTTGSTLGACASALRERGAGPIYGIAVSHA